MKTFKQARNFTEKTKQDCFFDYDKYTSFVNGKVRVLIVLNNCGTVFQ
jgi:hypothetical protein